MTLKLTSIPVRVEGGRLVLDQGPDEIHLLTDGATGVVVLPADAVSRHSLSSLEGLELLPAGTEVALPFKVTNPKADIVSHLVRMELKDLHQDSFNLPGFSLERFFAKLILLEPLRLKTNPKTLPSLHKCACHHPFFQESHPSLNAAFTAISKLCEPHKQANVGNVFNMASPRPCWDSGNASRICVICPD